LSGPDESQIQRAKVLAEDLLLVVRQEHAKMQLALQQQQMELHQAQAQYAAYSAMAAVRYSCIPFFFTGISSFWIVSLTFSVFEKN